jgi:fimbrial chaperone protein
MQLNDTKDIVVFPSLFTLKPGQQRLMRVGTLTPVASLEKTYRISVTELPPEQKPNQPQVIRVLTKLVLPIFIQPSQQVIDGGLSEVAVRNGKLSFKVKNTGNVHFTAQTVRVQGVGEADKSVFVLQRHGWYVLAGASQPYDLEITQKECSKTKALVIEVKTEKTNFQQRVEMPANACLKRE